MCVHNSLVGVSCTQIKDRYGYMHICVYIYDISFVDDIYVCITNKLNILKISQFL